MIRFIKDEDGQGMLEYVLIIALVAVVAIVAILAVRSILKNKSDKVSTDLASVDALE
ncbi:MAG: Flp family type IVb pilin [Eubacterium sp.]